MKLYFEKINEDFGENITEGVLFYRGTGKPGTKNKVSNFPGKRDVIGKTTLGDVGKEVARYLNLEHPEKHTGHCFRYVIFSTYFFLVLINDSLKMN